MTRDLIKSQAMYSLLKAVYMTGRLSCIEDNADLHARIFSRELIARTKVSQ